MARDIPTYDVEQLLSNPVRSLGAVVEMGTISPGTDYSVARWLYVGATGNVVIKMFNNETITLVDMAAGVWHPIVSIGVVAAGTTATNLAWGK